MPSLASFAAAFALSLLATAPAAASQDPVREQPAHKETEQKAQGHLVLLVAGTPKALRITHAVAKPSAWGGAPKGLKSPFRLRLLDRGGRLLREVPIDLSAFDTDEDAPARGRRVDGCKVRCSRIALLVNVPNLPTTARLELVRDGRPIGQLSRQQLDRLLRGGR